MLSLSLKPLPCKRDRFPGEMLGILINNRFVAILRRNLIKTVRPVDDSRLNSCNRPILFDGSRFASKTARLAARGFCIHPGRQRMCMGSLNRILALTKAIYNF